MRCITLSLRFSQKSPHVRQAIAHIHSVQKVLIET